MLPSSVRSDPTAVREARALWQREHFPPANAILGGTDGPIVHGLEGAFAPQEAGVLAVQRALASDVDARALALLGRRARGLLRREDSGPPRADLPLESLLERLGVWVGGSDGRPFDAAPRTAGIQAIAGRLARLGALAVRDVALRVCPACALVRDPERIVYEEEAGDTLLVRFPFTSGDRTVNALVWADSAWRLLGTSALLVHPDRPYVIARFRRRGDEELIFAARSSLDRIRAWLPGAEIEVLDEQPGRHWEGTPYVHPLRHEFPLGGGLEPPAGTILSIAEVTDTGTGVVPLVPGHGGTDAGIAERLGVPGWPLITPKGRFDIMLVHKYAGLELESGDEFVARDLAEDGSIFARLRVRRGVPHCARCGTGLVWAPGRAWCLEPSRLPAASRALYRSLLPNDRPIERIETVPWPVSEPARSEDPAAIRLLECGSCDRLDAPDGAGERCVCGGRRRPVARRLLPAFEAAAAAWSALDPLPRSDSVRLYLNDRRRAPALVHQLAAMSGTSAPVTEMRLTVLPTLPEIDLAAEIDELGPDAVRAALVRSEAAEGRTARFRPRCRQERERLARFARTSEEIVGAIDPSLLPSYGAPIAGALAELEPEDRALLARFERMRAQAVAEYDRGTPALAHRRLFRFLENDLDVYREWTAGRLAPSATALSKRGAQRTLLYIVAQSSLLLAPIAPHTAESIHARLAPRRASVFAETVAPADRALLDEERAKAWDRWRSVLGALDRFRRAHGIAPEALLPSAVLVLPTDPIAEAYRAEAPILERMGRLGKIEVASPSSPWTGRRRLLKPVESEIQRVYGARGAQLIHLLRRMPERKWTDGSASGFSVQISGQPTQVLPSMVDWVDVLPEHVRPVRWNDGELYVEAPTTTPLPAPGPPPLSSDAFRLVERLAGRARASRAERSTPPVALVVAREPLSKELAAEAVTIAGYLGLAELRLVASDREFPPGRRESGRDSEGVGWSFHLSGDAARPRARRRAPSGEKGARVRPAFLPSSFAPAAIDYSSEEFLAQEAAIRAFGAEVDQIMGGALIGPSKLRGAWQAGLHGVEDLRHAPWETLVGLPGFGEPVAASLVEHLGGTVPPRAPRARRAAVARTRPELPTDVPLASPDPARNAPPPLPEREPPMVPFGSVAVAPPAIVTPAPKVPERIEPRPPALSAPPPEAALPAGPADASLEFALPPPEEVAALPGPEEISGRPAGDTGAVPLGPASPPEGWPATPPPAPADALAPVTATGSDISVAPEPEASPVELAPGTSAVVPGSEPMPEPSSDGLAPAGEAVTPSEPTGPPLSPGAGPTGSPDHDADPEAAPEPPSPVPVTGAPEPLPVAAAPEVTVPSAPPPLSPGPSPEPRTGPIPPPPPVPTGEATLPPDIFDTGSVPLAPVVPTPTGGVELDVGVSYFPSLERFLDASAAGHLGICVVRDSPERVRAYAGSRPVEIRWLTNIGRGATLKPTDLEGFSAFLSHAVSQGRATVFFLEGVEYLVRLHGLERVVAVLTAFDALAREHAARVWVHLNPRLLSAAELERFTVALSPTGASG
ncbi:MAG TPA: class I tRNA ligase family protein [Thermoplasmata archaeon]|nr:class I tRNA ligase family protein [Thermoplasmata archaeon]